MTAVIVYVLITGFSFMRFNGELAQLGERLVCNQKVAGSIPVFSTIQRMINQP